MIRRLIVAIAVVSLPVVAGGEVSWRPKKGASSPDERSRTLRIAEGNEQLILARERARSDVQQSYATTGLKPRGWSAGVVTSARAAINAYEQALAIPSTSDDEADLHFRCMLAASRYLDDPGGYRAVVEHGTALREADPLDPREIEVTWDLSIAQSKLGLQGGPDAEKHFEQGIAEYERWRRFVDEASPNVSQALGQSWSNAAELMMAVGRLDEAIVGYEQAIDLDSTESLGFYGLAVALDRDGQWEKAKAAMSNAVIRDRQGMRLDDPDVFFVPDGDVHYYKALSAQVRGDKKTAISEYRLFLSETVDTKYAARGREHLVELGAHEARD